MNYNYLLIKKIKLEIIRLLKVNFIILSNLGEVMKSKLVLLSIVFSLIFTNSIFADQKKLIGADLIKIISINQSNKLSQKFF